MQRGPFRPDDPPVFPDAREVVAARIAKSIDEGVEESRAKLYREELERRSAFRKKTAVRALVNRLDQQLILAQEQRDQIAASLMEHYRETWGRQLEYLVYDHYRPNILDEWIVPHLNDNQRSVWQLSKNNSVSYFGWNNPGAMINENNWEINLPPLPVVAAEPAEGVLVEAVEAAEAKPARKKDGDGQDPKQDAERDEKAESGKKNEQPNRDESKAERGANERDNLPIVIERLLRHPAIEVLVVDDGSPDGTGDVADALAAAHARVHVLHRTGARGLGRSYVDGMRQAIALGATHVCQMDADLSHDPDVVPRLVEQAASADVVIGSRYVPGGSVSNWAWRRRALSAFANFYVRAVTRLPVRDCTSGFRAYRTSMLAAVDPAGTTAEGYAFLTELVQRLSRASARIVEVPIVFRDRARGQSKMSGAIIVESMLLVTRWGLRDRWTRFTHRRSRG